MSGDGLVSEVFGAISKALDVSAVIFFMKVLDVGC
jgi:hypothetical protein